MGIKEIMDAAINSKTEELNKLRQEAEESRLVRVKACEAFLKEIEPLRTYGIKYELRQRQYNVYSATEEYCYPRFFWSVTLSAKFHPFYTLECEIINNIPMARLQYNELWSRPYIKGENKEKYFTAEQFAEYWAEEISHRM